MKEIQLTQGKVAWIDDDDFNLVSQYKWCAHYQPRRRSGAYNAVSNITVDGKTMTLLMHRLIMNAPSTKLVDHKDRNPLNNQKNNLRLANQSQNGMNQGLRKDNTSGYKGVYFSKHWKKYVAQIKCNGKVTNLGGFDNAEDAASKYNEVATQLFGEFAVTNFVQQRQSRSEVTS